MWIHEELSHWTILLHRGYTHRTCVSGHVAELFYWPTSPRIDFPARWGTAALSTGCVTSWMQIFPICGSEEEDPFAWSARSPDLTPLDFFWGFVKNAVYQGDRSTTLEELRGRITYVAALMTPQMLQNTWREVEYHLDMCWATYGAHIELHWPSSETRRVFISSYVKVYVNNPLFTFEIITFLDPSSVDTLCVYNDNK